MIVSRGTRVDTLVALVRWLESAGVVYQVNGGWAVDALVGIQTRTHRDVDIFVDADHVADLDAWLMGRGYEVDSNWSPVRVEWVQADQRIDVHPMVLAENGDGVQAGFGDDFFIHRAVDRTRGRIAGQSIVVANSRRLRELRDGYRHRPEDIHDLRILDEVDGDVVEG